MHDVTMVKENDIKAVTEAMAVAPHPLKGNCLFATRNIKKGEVLLHTVMKDITVTKHACVSDLQKRLQREPNQKAQTDVLEHVIPILDGTLWEPVLDDTHCLFNHARPCNALHLNHYYSKPEWDTVATTDIPKGTEICIDYDDSSGYERRPDEQKFQLQGFVAEYLKLLANYGVEKRPTALTLPPAMFEVVSAEATFGYGGN